MSLLHKATPVLFVERIEPVLAFWKKLGIEPTVQVPEEGANDGRLGFVILAAEGFNVMYQSDASVRGDLVKSASVKDAFRSGPQQTVLYVEVAKLADVESALKGERLIMPRRTTFYGAHEVGYLEPGGNVVVFSEHAEQAAGS